MNTDNNSRIKVLHVYPELISGGVERVIENLIRYSDREKFSFSILTQKEGSRDSEFREMGVEIHRLPYEGDKKEYTKRLGEFFATNKFDVVHSHMHHQMMLVNRVAKAYDIRCRIAHSHINHPDWPWWKRLLRIPKFAMHNAGATDLVGCSEGALEWLFPIRDRESTVIPNGVDAEKYRYSDSRREAVRRELGIPPEKFVVLNAGRLAPQKNQDFILDIAAEMRENKRCEFLIAGEGPLQASLNERIERENLRNVRLLGENNDMPGLISATDVFLLPSHYEGASVVLEEALAGGMKVIINERLETNERERTGRGGKILRLSVKSADVWARRIAELASEMLSESGEKWEEARHESFNIDSREMAAAACRLYMKRL